MPRPSPSLGLYLPTFYEEDSSFLRPRGGPVMLIFRGVGLIFYIPTWMYFFMLRGTAFFMFYKADPYTTPIDSLCSQNIVPRSALHLTHFSLMTLPIAFIWLLKEVTPGTFRRSVFFHSTLSTWGRNLSKSINLIEQKLPLPSTCCLACAPGRLQETFSLYVWYPSRGLSGWYWNSGLVSRTIVYIYSWSMGFMASPEEE